MVYFNLLVEAGPSYILCSPLAIDGGLCWSSVRGLVIVACVSCLGQPQLSFVVFVVVAVVVDDVTCIYRHNLPVVRGRKTCSIVLEGRTKMIRNAQYQVRI